jgi:ribosomal protein L12E/L44/L45/RPP1/RPP2
MAISVQLHNLIQVAGMSVDGHKIREVEAILDGHLDMDNAIGSIGEAGMALTAPVAENNPAIAAKKVSEDGERVGRMNVGQTNL